MHTKLFTGSSQAYLLYFRQSGSIGFCDSSEVTAAFSIETITRSEIRQGGHFSNSYGFSRTKRGRNESKQSQQGTLKGSQILSVTRSLLSVIHLFFDYV
jgi:hypothetical protein